VGQSLRITGTWTDHKQYGRQFSAVDVEELRFNSDADMFTYLSSGGIPGVGPATAQRIRAKHGEQVEEVLDHPDAVAKLMACEGIGAKMAARIKSGWDASVGAREGARFLREAGLPLALAQKVAARFGPATREVIQADPYAALASFRMPLTKVEQVAAAVGAPPDLVSRAEAAVVHCLDAAAAQEGHSLLPWHELELRCRKLLGDMAKQHGASCHF
jgi:exodeoxyribonuclease V alpha subunit